MLVGLVTACSWLSQRFEEEKISPSEQTTPKFPAERNFLALGNPSGASTNFSTNPNNVLLVSDAYVVSYNNAKLIANWAAWRLTASDFGDAGRQNNFRPNPVLPSQWRAVTTRDYTGSGFDRGHLCPSADRTATPELNSETFLMTNITPQTPELNQGPWEKLETYSRSLARRDVDLIIYAGGAGSRGRTKNGIFIPAEFWKIIVVVSAGADISAVNRNTRVIAVSMPNLNGIKESNWRDFRTTVRQIEQKTGNDFLSNLPPDLQNFLETRIDTR